MAYSFYLGIDISKATFDYCLIDKEGLILQETQVLNNPTAIKAWIENLSRVYGNLDFWSNCLVCKEHSGYYGAPLLRTLHDEVETSIWVESALQIKRSIGVQRGKSDKVDAQRIAVYALDFQRKARLWKPTKQSIERLSLLISHRDRQVKYLMSLRNTLHEEDGFVEDVLHQEMIVLNDTAITALEQSIKELNRRIKVLLDSDIDLKKVSKIVQSIPGFGQVIASKLIAITHGFTRLTNPKALACFAGVAPFEHRSGTSIKGKTRISNLANKEIKKMLHLATLVTIRKNNIMYDYFNRKVAEGKNKMSVINAIRNKLIHILLACIKNNTTYQKNYNHSLA